MKCGKKGNLFNWNDDEYDEVLERETVRKQELKLLKAFKRFAEPKSPEKGKLQNTRSPG